MLMCAIINYVRFNKKSLKVKGDLSIAIIITT